MLHELAHIACPEKDHTELFIKIFVFFLQRAIEFGLYHQVDYKLHAKRYCGMDIDQTPLTQS
jgi:hypothetical protein